MIGFRRKQICKTAVNGTVTNKDNMEKSEKVENG